MKHSKYNNQTQYISTIIVALQMDIDMFMQHLQRGATYETLLHQWAVDLYEQQTPVAIAIKRIYQKRIQWMSGCITTYATIDKQQKSNYNKVMHRLQFHPLYIQLSSSDKKNVQQQVQQVVATNLYTPEQVERMVITRLKNQPAARNDTKPPDNDDCLSFSILVRSMIAQFKTLANIF